MGGQAPPAHWGEETLWGQDGVLMSGGAHAGGGEETEKELGPGVACSSQPSSSRFALKMYLVQGQSHGHSAVLVRTAFSVRESSRTVIPRHLAL